MPATIKMIDYAKSIADTLDLHYPDFTDYRETSKFISDNVTEFKSKLKANQFKLEVENIQKYVSKYTTSQFEKLILDLENIAGIYLFWIDNSVVYVGKSMNLQDRISSSLKERLKINRNINYLSIIPCEADADVHILEILLITELKPEYNKDCMCKDTSNHFSSGIDIQNLIKYKIFKENTNER